MNFKEVYSKANDEIHGNDALLDKILTSVPEKKTFRILYAVPVLAMAAMVTLVITVPGMMEKKLTPDVGTVRVADSRQAEETPDIQTANEDEPPSLDVIVKEADVSKLPEAEINYEPEYESPYLAEEVTETVEADVPDTVSVPENVLKVNYVDGLWGAEATVMSRGITPVVEMTLDEYSVYIGKNVSSLAVIPEDMTMMSPEVIIAETDSESGEIVSEKAVFLAHSEDYERFAEINVTRTQDVLIPEDGMEISEINGNRVVVISDNTDYNASFSENGAEYFIRCGGITEDELKNLLISLNGGSTNEQEDFSRNNGGSDGSIISGNDDGIG